MASPTGLKAEAQPKPSSQPVDHARKDNDANLTDYPEFVDLDRDGHAEICIPYFHGSGDGSWELWRLGRDGYRLWWPEETVGHHVTDAEVADLDGYGCGSLVAVMMPRDPHAARDVVWNPSRLMTVWRQCKGQWRQVATARLPDSDEPWGPEVVRVRRSARETTIFLNYGGAESVQFAFRADSLHAITP